jgi:phospholipid/cholesterol/gamma-HCH transport system substrate-binding protein
MTRRTGIFVTAFVAASTALLLALFAIFSEVRIGPTQEYGARFADVSGLRVGSPVRIAGVTVGKVTALHLEKDLSVLVSLRVDTSVTLTRATEASVHYRNLIGDRYLQLDQGTGSDTGTPLPAHGVVPVSHTAPALDLDQLANGFKPLMAALSPDDVNQLSRSIVQVLDGQAGTVDALLGNVASLSSTLADRDQVIGRLISDLNGVLGTVSADRSQLDQVVVNLQQLVSGLAADRSTIGTAITHIATFTDSATGLLQALRPQLQGALGQAGRLTSELVQQRAVLDPALQDLPEALSLLGRGGAYGSFFNFYLCGFNFALDGPNGSTILTPYQYSAADRCKFSQDRP